MSVRTRFGVIVYYFIGVSFSAYHLDPVDAAEGGAPPGGKEEPPRRESPSPLLSAHVVEPRLLVQEAAEKVRQLVLTGQIRQRLGSSAELRDLLTRFFELLDEYYYRLYGTHRPETVYVSFYSAAREGLLRKMLDDSEVRAMAVMYLEIAAGDMGASCCIWNSAQRTFGTRNFVNTLTLLRTVVAEGRIIEYLDLPRHQYLFLTFYASLLRRHVAHGLPLRSFDGRVTKKLKSGELAAVLQDPYKRKKLMKQLKADNSVLTSGGEVFPPELPLVHTAFRPHVPQPEVAKASSEPHPAIAAGGGWVPRSPRLLRRGAGSESPVPTETSEFASTSLESETMTPSQQQGAQPSGAPSASAPDPKPSSAPVPRGRAGEHRRGLSAVARTRPLSALEPSVPFRQPPRGPHGRWWSSLAHPFRKGPEPEPEPPEPSAPPEDEYRPSSSPVTIAAQFHVFTSAPADPGGHPRPAPYNPEYLNPATAVFVEPMDFPPSYYGELGQWPYPAGPPPRYALRPGPPPPYTPCLEPTRTPSQSADTQDPHAYEGPSTASGSSFSQARSPPTGSARGEPPTEEQQEASAMVGSFERRALGARPNTNRS